MSEDLYVIDEKGQHGQERTSVLGLSPADLASLPVGTVLSNDLGERMLVIGNALVLRAYEGSPITSWDAGTRLKVSPPSSN
jgi:hypothetical protein